MFWSSTSLPEYLTTHHWWMILNDQQSEGDEMGILALLRQMQSKGDLSYRGRLYGVHRLDRVTSGILLLAKDVETAKQLTKAFREGEIVKYYMGISRMKPKRKKQGWVKGGMERGRRKSWYLTPTQSDHHKLKNFAKTRFFTRGLGALQDNVVEAETHPRTLLLFRPYTGRTHQLRVAAKSVGLPLAGDPIYRDGFSLESMDRTYLHATAIRIPVALHADADTAVTVVSPPPFEHLWTEEGAAVFRGIVANVFEKHCDCDEITKLVVE